MALDNRGRRGLPRATIDHALRLLARDERLSDQVIAERVGCSDETVRKLRRGIHRSQQDDDRRGARPERVRLAEELLARPWPIARVARFLGMRRDAVRDLARGRYITQRR